MELIGILEEKIALLIAKIQQLKTDNSELSDKYEKLKQAQESLVSEHKSLKKENLRLLEEETKLTARLEEIENSLLHGSAQIEGLSQERELAKVVIDDLIKSIDSLVESEKQP